VTTFSPVGGIGASTLLLAWLCVGVPWLGVQNYKKLKAALARGEPRTTFYRRMIIRQIGLTLVTLLFERSMRSPYPEAIMIDATFITIVFVGAILLPLLSRNIRTRMAAAARQIPNSLLPITIRERALFAVISVGAGLSEELAYRGFFFHTIQPFGVPVVGALLLSSIAFGVAHLFQGRRGVIATGILGGFFGALYLVTGSLWPAVLVHVVIDLRFVFLDLRTVSDGGPRPE
jgi:membrane protease YdiL (CAAX protease family)